MRRQRGVCRLLVHLQVINHTKFLSDVNHVFRHQQAAVVNDVSHVARKCTA